MLPIKQAHFIKNLTKVKEIQILHDEISIVVESKQTHTLNLIKHFFNSDMKVLNCISGVDYPARKKRFEVVYELLSLRYNFRLRIKTILNEISLVTSASKVFWSAGWYEREVWDLFGTFFTEHPDLRRILTDYGFSGHPLRKDFPVTGFADVRYSETKKRVIHEPLSLAHELRMT
jgi:NADH/F420H2 dehydrogenase subunit C